MATINIFVSFEYDKDLELKNNFFEQARLLNPNYRIKNCSLNETFRESDWQQKARAMIEQCDVVIVLLGEDTNNAPGVRTEVRIANRLNKPIFQIKPQRRPYRNGATNAGKVITGRWKYITRTEVPIANRLNKRIFQIKPQRRRNQKGVANAGEVIIWRWKRINRKLNKMFG